MVFAYGTMTSKNVNGSSLQQAVSTARLRTRNGAFESSFDGLDLSEFDSKTDDTPAARSASAALLQVKAAEAQARHQHQQEEDKLRHLASQRSNEIARIAATKTSAKQKKTSNDHNSEMISRLGPGGSTNQSNPFLDVAKGSFLSDLVQTSSAGGDRNRRQPTKSKKEIVRVRHGSSSYRSSKHRSGTKSQAKPQKQRSKSKRVR